LYLVYAIVVLRPGVEQLAPEAYAEVLIAAMEEQRLFLAEVQRLRVELERFNQNLSLIANNPREPNVWGLLPPQT